MRWRSTRLLNSSLLPWLQSNAIVIHAGSHSWNGSRRCASHPYMNALCSYGFKGADSDERSASYFAKERVQRGKPRYAAEYQWHSPELPPDRLGRYRIGTRPGDEDFTGWVCGAR